MTRTIEARGGARRSVTVVAAPVPGLALPLGPALLPALRVLRVLLGLAVALGPAVAPGPAAPTGPTASAASGRSAPGTVAPRTVAAGTVAPRTVAPGAVYGWPLGPPAPVVVRPFAAPTHQFGPGHRGVDLAAAPGSPVLAAAAGVVVFAGPVAGRGVVSVQHPDGLRTTYEPVAAGVRAGAAVARGDVLGTLRPGHPGCPTGCLHWGVRRDRTTYVDPLRLLAPPHVRLLPLPDPWPDGPGGDPGTAGGPSAVSSRAGEVTPGGAPGRGPPSAARR